MLFHAKIFFISKFNHHPTNKKPHEYVRKQKFLSWPQNGHRMGQIRETFRQH